jgi:hypothetical protein
MALTPPVPPFPWAQNPWANAAPVPFPITATPEPEGYEIPPLVTRERVPLSAVRVRYPGLEPCCVAWALEHQPFLGLKPGEANYLMCNGGAGKECRIVMTWANGAWEKAAREFQGW